MKWWSGIESGIRFSTASNASEARKILTTCWQRVFSSSRVCSISIRLKTKVYSTRSEDNERGSFKWCRWKFHRIMRMNIMVASRFFEISTRNTSSNWFHIWNDYYWSIIRLLVLILHLKFARMLGNCLIGSTGHILCCIKGFGSPWLVHLQRDVKNEKYRLVIWVRLNIDVIWGPWDRTVTDVILRPSSSIQSSQ